MRHCEALIYCRVKVRVRVIVAMQSNRHPRYHTFRASALESSVLQRQVLAVEIKGRTNPIRLRVRVGAGFKVRGRQFLAVGFKALNQSSPRLEP